MLALSECEHLQDLGLSSRPALVEFHKQMRLLVSFRLRKLAAGSRLGSRGISFSFYCGRAGAEESPGSIGQSAR